MLLLEKKDITPALDLATGQALVSRTPLKYWLGELLRRMVLFPLLRLFTRPRIYGREHLEGYGPYIFAANHASHLDTLLLLLALPLRLRLRLRVAAAADYFFTRKWKGALVSTLFNAFPFERKGGAGSTASLDSARELLRAGYSILIFPEGTRTQTGQMQPFKRGVGTLALGTAAPVVPVWIAGSYAAFPRGTWLPRFHRVSIIFGAPLRCSQTTHPVSAASEIEQQVRLLASSSINNKTIGYASQHERMLAAMTTKPLLHEREQKSAASVGSRSARNEKRYGGIYAIKPWWQRRLAGLEDLLVRKRVHPDAITLAGLLCASILGVMLALSGTWTLCALAVAPLAIGRLAANALDGLVARRTGLARPMGEVFNEGCDRLSDILIFAGLAFNSHVSAPLAWSTLVLALLSSYLGIAAKAAGGRRQFGGLLAKADRMIFLALFSPLVLLFGATAWNWLLLAFLPMLLFTLVQRYRWTYRDLQQTATERS